MRGTIYGPAISNGEIDCPKAGCGGVIQIEEMVCWRCLTRIIRIYKRRRRIKKLTYRNSKK